MPVPLYALMALVLVGRVQLEPALEEVVYFTATTGQIRLPAWLLLAQVFGERPLYHLPTDPDSLLTTPPPWP